MQIPKAYIGLIIVSILSKLFGFFREMIIASKFGISADLDLFLVALTVPNLIYSVLLYAVPNIIIPQFSGELLKSDKESLSSFSSRFFWPYTLVLSVVSVVYYMGTPLIIKSMAGNALHQNVEIAVSMARYFTFFMFFSSLYCAFKGYYHLKKWFLLPAIAPLSVHIFVITFVWIWGESLGVKVIVYGMVIGSLVQLAILFSDVWKKDLLKYFGFSPVGLGSLKKSVVVILLIEILGQTYTFIDRSFVSFLPEGYMSGLNYASLLNMLPIGILGLTLGAVILPDFSRHVINKDADSLRKALLSASKMVIFTGVMCALVLFFGGEIIVKLVLQRGQFDSDAAFVTQQFLKYLSIGIPFIMFHAIIAKFYLSIKKEIWLLVFIIIAIIVKVITAKWFLNHNWYFGLALSTVIAFAVNDLLLVLNVFRMKIFKQITN